MKLMSSFQKTKAFHCIIGTSWSRVLVAILLTTHTIAAYCGEERRPKFNLREVYASNRPIVSMCWLDERHVACSFYCDAFILVDIEEVSAIELRPGFEPVKLLRHPKEPSKIVVVGSDRLVCIDWKQKLVGKPIHLPIDSVKCAQITNNGQLLLGCYDATVCIIDLEAKQVPFFVKPRFRSTEPMLQWVSCSSDGSFVAACYGRLAFNEEKRLIVWKTSTMEVVSSSIDQPICGVFSGTSKDALVVQGPGKHLEVLDVRNKLRSTETINLPSIAAVLVCDPGRSEIIGSLVDDSIIRVKDGKVECLAEFDGTVRLGSIVLSPSGRQISVETYRRENHTFGVSILKIEKK